MWKKVFYSFAHDKIKWKRRLAYAGWRGERSPPRSILSQIYGNMSPVTQMSSKSPLAFCRARISWCGMQTHHKLDFWEGDCFVSLTPNPLESRAKEILAGFTQLFTLCMFSAASFCTHLLSCYTPFSKTEQASRLEYRHAAKLTHTPPPKEISHNNRGIKEDLKTTCFNLIKLLACKIFISEQNLEN